MSAGAVIVAGGSGKRMGSQTPKQFLNLDGLPIVTHTIRAFLACPAVARIILVVPVADFEFCRTHIIPFFGSAAKIALAAGGRQRRDSVYAGLMALEGSQGLVVIHDAVRPFVRPEIITACIAGAHQWGACIAGLPMHDTLKKIENDFIAGTVDRTDVWLAQTPQAFHYDLIRKAHEFAKAEEIDATDDASLVERLGHPVKMIFGNRTNIKITTPEDLVFANILISMLKSNANVVK